MCNLQFSSQVGHDEAYHGGHGENWTVPTAPITDDDDSEESDLTICILSAGDLYPMSIYRWTFIALVFAVPSLVVSFAYARIGFRLWSRQGLHGNIDGIFDGGGVLGGGGGGERVLRAVDGQTIPVVRSRVTGNNVAGGDGGSGAAARTVASPCPRVGTTSTRFQALPFPCICGTLADQRLVRTARRVTATLATVMALFLVSWTPTLGFEAAGTTASLESITTCSSSTGFSGSPAATAATIQSSTPSSTRTSVGSCSGASSPVDVVVAAAAPAVVAAADATTETASRRSWQLSTLPAEEELKLVDRLEKQKEEGEEQMRELQVVAPSVGRDVPRIIAAPSSDSVNHSTVGFADATAAVPPMMMTTTTTVVNDVVVSMVCCCCLCHPASVDGTSPWAANRVGRATSAAVASAAAVDEDPGHVGHRRAAQSADDSKAEPEVFAADIQSAVAAP